MNKKCRFCQSSLKTPLIDLGFAPPSNDYLNKEDLYREESYLPLRVLICEKCWLVQTQDFKAPEDLFKNDYAYFSSSSSSWLNHAENFAHKIISELNLNKNSFIVEIACNDGYLLKNFVKKKSTLYRNRTHIFMCKISKELRYRYF